MKSKILVLLILALALSACQPSTPAVEPPVEEPAAEEPLVEEPVVEEPAEEPEVEEEEEAQLLSVEIEEEPAVFLNAFVEINLVEENESYAEVPVFVGPTNLVNFWDQKVKEGFYTHFLDEWEQIKDVQARVDDSDDLKDFTVYRIETSVFEDPLNLVLLARNLSVYGYSWLNRDSAVFYIERATGNTIGPAEQLAGHGKTMEDTLALLQLFQDDNSQIPFDDLSVDERTALYEENEAIQNNMRAIYGSGKPVILNDFRSPEAFIRTDVFVAEIEGEVYYVVKLLLASLEENMLDSNYRDDIWVGIPVDYSGGTLTRVEDASGQLDFIYE